MRFFDEHGHSIDCAQWLGTYEPQYFLNSPTTKRINQGSRFVEDEVSSLLRKDALLCEDDLKLLMAWKIGAINHRASEGAQKILYYSGWQIQTKFRYFRFADSIR
jgi:hypothetical protein